MLAGLIVEAVSGESIDNYITKNILLPLGMSSSFVTFPESQRERLATGYGRRMPDGTRDVIPHWDAQGMTAACGMSSTVMDMAKYVAWQIRLLDGDQREILTPQTWRKARHVHWVDPSWDKGWGFGFEVAHQEDRDLVGHGGQMPGFFTSTFIDHKQKLGVIVLTNSMDAQPYLGQPRSIQERIFEWVGEAITQADDEEQKPTPAEWKRYEGTYRCIWCDASVMTLDGQLVLFDPTQPNPKDLLTTLASTPGRPDEYHVEKAPECQEEGEKVTFEFDAGAERARSVTVGSAKLERVDADRNDRKKQLTDEDCDAY